MSEVDIGVNVAHLLGAREAIDETPPLGQFEFRATSEWKHRTHSQSKVEKYFGFGEEQSHNKTYNYNHADVVSTSVIIMSKLNNKIYYLDYSV